jgi:hypothetical protein
MTPTACRPITTATMIRAVMTTVRNVVG